MNFTRSALRPLVWIALALLVLPVAAMAQETGGWRIMTADFASRRVQLAKVNEEGVVVVAGDASRSEVPANRLVRLERPGSASKAEGVGPFVLHLRDGDRLAGQIRRLTETALVMELAGLGEVHVPLELLLAVGVNGNAQAEKSWRQPPPPADEVLLANGDRLTGYVSGIDGETWRLTTEAGGEIPVAASAIRQVRFADPGVPAPRTGRGWRVGLADGSVLSLETLTFDEGRFSLGFRGRQADLAEAAVLWIEPVDGPVRWVSELPIAEQEQTPYFGAAYPTEVVGLGDGDGRGFIVHSRSRLLFSLPEGFARFRVRYQVPPEMSHANVDLRIRLDDKVVHEHKSLTAGDTPEPVDLPLAGARKLVLEVDYGQGLDVQDVVHWIEPVLIRGE